MSQLPTAPDPSGLDAHASCELLRLMADSVPVMLAYYDARQLRCTFANQGFADFVGRPADSLRGLPARETLDAQTWQQLEPLVQRALAGETVQHTVEHPQPGGLARVLELHLRPHLGAPDGRPAGLILLINDVSLHWQARQAAQQSEERMRKFAEATEEGLVFHEDGLILDANEPVLRMTGYALAEVVGHSIFDFILPEYRATAREYTRRAREYPYELALRHKSGRTIPVEAVGKTLVQPQGEHRVVVVRDITARHQAQERARFLALHDTLTQLPNRRHLMQQLARAAAAARQGHTRLALLFIDLDHFKTVNESLGHEAGDQLLCEMARRLQDGVQATDFVARVGGDQFVVLLPDLLQRSAAAALADRLMRLLSAPQVIGETPLSLSPSVGISFLPDDGYGPDELLRRATAALQRAKDSGRGTRLFYASDMEGQPAATLQQEHLLRAAVARQDLRLYYQPQVHLASGRLAGFEALVRWQQQGGLVGPGEFIPLAESRGLIAPISRWVLREACRQLKAWHDEGLLRVPVAVNLSAIEFRQRDVVGEIAQVLADTGLAPKYLEIEITETTLMQQAEHSQTTLRALRALGVAVTVDDFGTGYSSLAYLKRYPLDKIKVDRSFVSDTPGDADDVAIVTAIIALARSLQLRSVAEGVETPEQLALLRQLGCELAQGYGIAAPMDAERTHAWLQALPGTVVNPSMTKP